MNVFKIIKFIFFIILMFIVFYVLTANTTDTTLKILPFPNKTVSYPLSFVLFMAFFLGVMVSGIYAVLESMKLNRAARKLSKENALLKKEIENLRKEPLFDDDMAGSTSEDGEELEEHDNPLDEEILNKIR